MSQKYLNEASVKTILFEPTPRFLKQDTQQIIQEPARPILSTYRSSVSTYQTDPDFRYLTTVGDKGLSPKYSTKDCHKRNKSEQVSAQTLEALMGSKKTDPSSLKSYNDDRFMLPILKERRRDRNRSCIIISNRDFETKSRDRSLDLSACMIINGMNRTGGPFNDGESQRAKSFRVTTTAPFIQTLNSQPFLLKDREKKSLSRNLSYSNLKKQSRKTDTLGQKDDVNNLFSQTITVGSFGKNNSMINEINPMQTFMDNNVYKTKSLIKKISLSQLKLEILAKKRLMNTIDITKRYIPILKTKK